MHVNKVNANCLFTRNRKRITVRIGRLVRVGVVNNLRIVAYEPIPTDSSASSSDDKGEREQ